MKRTLIVSLMVAAALSSTTLYGAQTDLGDSFSSDHPLHTVSAGFNPDLVSSTVAKKAITVVAAQEDCPQSVGSALPSLSAQALEVTLSAAWEAAKLAGNTAHAMGVYVFDTLAGAAGTVCGVNAAVYVANEIVYAKAYAAALQSAPWWSPHAFAAGEAAAAAFSFQAVAVPVLALAGWKLGPTIAHAAVSVTCPIVTTTAKAGCWLTKTAAEWAWTATSTVVSYGATGALDLSYWAGGKIASGATTAYNTMYPTPAAPVGEEGMEMQTLGTPSVDDLNTEFDAIIAKASAPKPKTWSKTVFSTVSDAARGVVSVFSEASQLANKAASRLSSTFSSWFGKGTPTRIIAGV